MLQELLLYLVEHFQITRNFVTIPEMSILLRVIEVFQKMIAILLQESLRLL